MYVYQTTCISTENFTLFTDAQRYTALLAFHLYVPCWLQGWKFLGGRCGARANPMHGGRARIPMGQKICSSLYAIESVLEASARTAISSRCLLNFLFCLPQSTLHPQHLLKRTGDPWDMILRLFKGKPGPSDGFPFSLSCAEVGTTDQRHPMCKPNTTADAPNTPHQW